ncbi:hypothetical protein J2X72_003418 [Phyllobacterium sp. 1468]|nr:hypothetical protein [Phyllobacterium sp. 1468]
MKCSLDRRLMPECYSALIVSEAHQKVKFDFASKVAKKAMRHMWEADVYPNAILVP